MFELLGVLNHGFQDFLDNGDPRVKNWPLMRTPFPGMVMISAYVYFVKVAGPRFMKNRQPYDLRAIMVAYNFLMVFLNLLVFLGCGWYGWFDGYSLRCQPVDYSNNYKAVKMAEVGWWFYMTKFIEFADTIFFVLRKKDSQISALHVIHHSVVPFSLWFGIKFAPGGYNALIPFLNGLVHVIMYTYYGLAAMGYKKCAAWKKYLTCIQMSQFIAVIVFAVSLYSNGCPISRVFIFMNFIHALLFFGLFMNFFYQSYTKKPRVGQPKLDDVPPEHRGTLGPSQPSNTTTECCKTLQNGTANSVKSNGTFPTCKGVANGKFCQDEILEAVQKRNGYTIRAS